MGQKSKPRSCAYCNSQFFLRDRNSKYCSDDCRDKDLKERRADISSRISKGRKKYLKENPDKHPWKRMSKFKSVPCEHLKSKLIERGVQFVEEYTPDDIDRNFSIDIAFPDEKIGIEVNGNQHYNAVGQLTEYYQERHDILVEAGWKIIELHYSTVYTIDVDDIIDFDWKNKDYTSYIEEQKRRKVKKPKRTREQYFEDVRRANRNVEIHKIDLVKSSDIDFSKMGWVSKVAEIIEKQPQKVNEWMKKYMPEFYERNCFKRKRTSLQKS